MKVLGIETSCDETAIAVVDDGVNVLSNVVASSLELHKRYGGIVPEIATRHHVETILGVLDQALKEANTRLEEIGLIAVTQGPGLIGSLIVGITFAKSLAFALKKPIMGIDHLLAHVYSVYISGGNPSFPYLGIVISGGHTLIFLMEDFTKFKLIGKTRDDAIGEAYDKVAKILGLGFPGGPIVEKRAKLATKKEKLFPVTSIGEGYDFSYSGLKTAVLYYVKQLKVLDEEVINNICYAFQEAAIASLIGPIKKALHDFDIKSLVVGGGVAINKRVREELSKLEVELYLPQPRYCSDNAAMVAGLAYRLYNMGWRNKLDFEPYSTFWEKWKEN